MTLTFDELNVQWLGERGVKITPPDGDPVTFYGGDDLSQDQIITGAVQHLARSSGTAIDLGGWSKVDDQGNLTVGLPTATMFSQDTAVGGKD